MAVMNGLGRGRTGSSPHTQTRRSVAVVYLVMRSLADANTSMMKALGSNFALALIAALTEGTSPSRHACIMLIDWPIDACYWEIDS